MSDPRGERLRPGFVDAIAIGLIAVVAAVALWQSWARWLHPVIDAGRDLYLGTHLLRGAMLYSDVAYVYPPLAPHLLAVVTSMFGTSLAVFAAIGIGVGVVIAACLYFLARRHSGVDAAFAASLVFVATCFAGATTYGANYVFPYTYAATIGLALFLVFLAATARLVVEGPGGARFAVALVAGTAAAWCKLEFALFVLVTGFAAIMLLMLARRLEPSRALRVLVGSLAALSFPLVVARAVFGPLFFESVLPNVLLAGPVAKSFYEKVTGLDRWQANLEQALIGAVLTLLYLAIVRAVDRRAERSWRDAGGLALLVVLLVALAGVAFVLGNDRFFRGWLLIQLALVPFAIGDLRRARQGGDAEKGVLLLMPLLLVAAAASTSRIWLNLSPVWYGFVFVVPVLPLIVDVLFRYLPSRGVFSRRAALLWFPLFFVIAGRELELQKREWSAKTHPIYAEGGVFYDSSAERARAINGLIARVEELGATELVVLPEGLTINYAANVGTPLRINTFTPAELPTPELEKAAIAEFERAKPQYVAVTTQEAAAFGFRGFGIDYGLELDRYLRGNYVLDRRWTSSTFSLFLLRRR
ncbi:MAG: hypothetical protein ACSLFQ_11505 [Thermoanaerobaculia bacterium]